ncbi:helix-turn-helix transcriptional regulator [Streptomyces sp. AS02]|uniref:helix-turn-helix domain-containing protein n=1 Tax=Streptomyces sp. AS02 TaxID=2938946 RepID=UPI002020BDE2|nr:helix-turn-helix transcriptional regulator [Streptomyces sp. AS02]MCL8015755.1 helix-turn-helix transcriptional regulator [Streptomyces sp. AS02]
MADERERRPETPAEAEGTTELFSALGKMLRLLRERKGWTQKEFGSKVGYGPDQIGAMERGVRVTRPEFLVKADELLDAGGLLLEAIDDVKKAMAKARTRHPEWYRGYAALEAEAKALHVYSNQLVPGLLQTEDYAQAVFAQWRPLLSEETIEKRVADRMTRQRILENWPSPTFSFVLDESVLLRPIGGREVHAAQLENLLRLGSLRTVALQVMPMEREEQPSMDGPFNLLTVRKGEQVAYVEIHTYPRLITDAEEVRILNERYGLLRAHALRPNESLDLIEKLRGRL